MASKPILPRLLAVLLGASVCVPAAAQSDIRLPDLGSSADALISNQEAQSYGASMVREMRALNMVVDDPLLEAYINDLGHRLSSAGAKPKDHFAFFIVKSPEINAFAAPGGYIAVNSGLITITQNEAELASVIAHEIGHITQNHLQRAFEASKKDAPLMALVLLGAIAAGAGAGAGDAAGAILMGGQGLLAQKQINFTRKDEIEADRAGIQTLAKAGFDPNAMAEFFGRMADTMRTGSGGDDVPALLQDHPVTGNRISDAKSRAGALIAMQKLQVTPSALSVTQWSRITAPVAYVRDPSALVDAAPDQAAGLSRYLLMRERVRVLSGDTAKLVKYYGNNLAEGHGFDTPANRYGYALALIANGRSSKAVGQLQGLLLKHPENNVLRLAMANAQFHAGQHAESLAIYKNLNEQSPRDPAIALPYAKALVTIGGKASFTQAAQLLRPMLDDTEDPDIYLTYARASDAAGEPARAAEAFADASYLSGRPFDALQQLRRVLKRDDLDYYARARVQARIADLTPLVMELRKRKVQTPDNPDRPSQR